MQETILPKLEASRKELLDLGMRNTLLNYKIPKARGLHIVQEQSSSIFNILVKQNKAMTFLARPGKDDDDAILDLPELSEPELQDAYNDTRLQTNETELKLQTKILNTYYFAKTSIEEQGVNILYLSLGMLNWYEKGNTEAARLAPLILIPVTLERSSANERFRLRYSDAEIGINLSLQAKMLADFNITIPNFPEQDELDVALYMDDINARIQHLENWKVDTDTIELGFFSFGKFMIYHDLDSAKWPDNNKPFHNSIIQALLGNGFNDPQPSYSDHHHLDNETNASDLLQVVDADSSQIIAMLAVHEGRNLVIQGPPGTGKSQTITNIIANAVGNGKKVLFVAEKMAALEVVKRRLDNINLGEACLELHSHKANKRELHDELKKVLELGKPTLTHLEDEIRVLESLVNELNAYCTDINTQITQSGQSAQDVIGNLLKISDSNPNYKFPKITIPDLEYWDSKSIKKAELLAEQIQVRLANIGLPENLLFDGTGLTLFLPKDEDVSRDYLDDLVQVTTNLIHLCEETATYLIVNTPQDSTSTETLINLAILASQTPGLETITIDDSSWLDNQADIAELIESGSRLATLHKEYDAIFIPEAWEQNVLEIRQNLITHGQKWYNFLIGDYKKSIKQLAGLLNTSLPKDLDTQLLYVNSLMEGKRLNAKLVAFEDTAIRLLGKSWQKTRSDWEYIKRVTTYLKTVHQAIIDGLVPSTFISFLKKNETPTTALQYSISLKEELAKQKSISTKLCVKIDYPIAKFSKRTFPQQLELSTRWVLNLPEIHKAVSWNILKENIEKEGGTYLLTVIEGWEDAHSHLKIALQKTWLEFLIENAMMNSSTLRKFERSNHEDIIDKFKKLDIVNLFLNRAKIALKHWENIPRHEGGGQINILRGEFNRKARHMPIRKLIQEAGLAIQEIKPVFMMSPMSIANFLSPNSIDFDLVIFDEASQVRPVDALGAILRGKQLVVVGDTKQMPPTSFFDKLNTETEDEDNVTADMQSILGMCDAQNAPQRMLRWHYRSRHESLISLSNQEFYENKLVIFPSPGSKQRMGLKFHLLSDTFYDKGKTRTNPKEAEKVADAVIDHAIHHPKQSLGVVAFSTSQMQAIQNALEIKRRKRPEVESFFRNHSEEPFFIKNLENVQGDERDVIFISIGYGRLEDGKVPMSFGPLNNEGGERRLNVLITRAKSRCEVFTNITANDIIIGTNTKFGIRALKSFLYFAEHGKFERNTEEINIIQPSFEEIVADSLRKAGYIVREKVGSSGFFIDLAVVDVDNPGRYLLGINCDGKSYANAKSARDRDRLRNSVLEGMGWKLYNIWSIDWFRNPTRELELLVESIENAKIIFEQNDTAEEELLEELKSFIRTESQEVEVILPFYQSAVLSEEVKAMELHLFSLGQLSKWIKQVVEVESPIHFEEMARRIADANGISKIGSRIRAKLVEATEYAVRDNQIVVKGDFLWHPQMTTPYIRERSLLTTNSRKFSFIAPEEIIIAVRKVVENAIAIQPDSAIPLIAKLFGFGRVTEDVRKAILSTIDNAIAIGTITNDGDILKIKKS